MGDGKFSHHSSQRRDYRPATCGRVSGLFRRVSGPAVAVSALAPARCVQRAGRRLPGRCFCLSSLAPPFPPFFLVLGPAGPARVPWAARSWGFPPRPAPATGRCVALVSSFLVFRPAGPGGAPLGAQPARLLESPDVLPSWAGRRNLLRRVASLFPDFGSIDGSARCAQLHSSLWRARLSSSR